VIADPTGSVGSYINRARKSDLLVEVWLVAHGVLCSHETPAILKNLCVPHTILYHPTHFLFWFES
jgi:hypothetical protein